MIIFRHLIRTFLLMLVTVFGAGSAFATQLAPSDFQYSQLDQHCTEQASDVGIAACAPRFADQELAFAGNLAALPGSGFALREQEINVALRGFDGGFLAPNRTVTDFIDGVTVVDRRTGTTFTGTVDLRPTLDRIDNGIPHPHRNDGSTFRNNEGLLPSQPEGYYTEFVHPTPGVNGPGPQRIIRGQGGELYYTPDHYGSFIPLN